MIGCPQEMGREATIPGKPVVKGLSKRREKRPRKKEKVREQISGDVAAPVAGRPRGGYTASEPQTPPGGGAALPAKLPEPELRRIAGLRLEEYTTEEIAEHLGIAERTVRRKPALIRSGWEKASSA
jgi:hypothetical protein